MAIENVELMQEYFPKHSRMGTAKMKLYKETEGKKRCVSLERSKVDTKEKDVPTAY